MQRILVVLFCFILLSCNDQGSSAISKSPAKVDTVTFKKDIPNEGAAFMYALKKKEAVQLKLDSLESGFDSLEIRIWYDYTRLINRDLLVIRRTNGEWSAMHYMMTISWDSIKDINTIEIDTMKYVTPKSGWGKFVNELLELKIMTLPDMNDIPGLEDNWADGKLYNVEIATEEQFRFYSYHLPEKFKDQYWQAKNMTEILKLISTELGVREYY